MSTKRIVCDTMVWYYIGNGTITEQDLGGLNLLCTYTTIREIGTSHHWINNFGYIQNAVNAIHNYGTIDFRNPYEVLAEKFIGNFKPKIKENQEYWEAIRRIANSNLVLPDASKPQAREVLNSLTQKYVSVFDDINKDIRAIKTNNRGKAPLTYQQYANRFRKYWAITLNQYLYEVHKQPIPFGISLSKKAWEELEFAEAVQIEFSKKLDRSSETFKVNDQDDQLNLFYVRPQDLYWTYERKWIDYANSAGMNRLLFNHPNLNFKTS